MKLVYKMCLATTLLATSLNAAAEETDFKQIQQRHTEPLHFHIHASPDSKTLESFIDQVTRGNISNAVIKKNTTSLRTHSRAT